MTDVDTAAPARSSWRQGGQLSDDSSVVMGDEVGAAVAVAERASQGLKLRAGQDVDSLALTLLDGHLSPSERSVRVLVVVATLQVATLLERVLPDPDEEPLTDPPKHSHHAHRPTAGRLSLTDAQTGGRRFEGWNPALLSTHDGWVDWDEWLDLRFGGRDERQRYVGLEAEEAVKVAQADGVTDIRVLDLSAPEGVFLHDDQRGYRLNLAVRDKRVVRAAFF